MKNCKHNVQKVISPWLWRKYFELGNGILRKRKMNKTVLVYVMFSHVKSALGEKR